VLQKEPGNIRAWYFKGIVLLHTGQSEPAIACFEKVVQARPDDGVAWYLLGMCKQRAGQKAEQELRKAVELRPYLTSAYYKLWQTYQAEGQADKAQPFLDKFMRLRDSPLNEIIEVPQYNQMGDLALAQPIRAQTAFPTRQVHLSRRNTHSDFAPQPDESAAGQCSSCGIPNLRRCGLRRFRP
jgi:tetratricopeptide (TPR) repeat protein